MRKEIPESIMIPKYYGIAWINPSKNFMAVCYPIPINFIMGWGLFLLIILKQGPRKLVEKTHLFLKPCNEIKRLKKQNDIFKDMIKEQAKELDKLQE